MVIRTVRATIHFVTPFGELEKKVNWSGFEERANLTTSTTSQEAFNRFLINAPRIINASKQYLQHMKSVAFYEEVKKARGPIERVSYTATIVIGENMKLEVLYK